MDQRERRGQQKCLLAAQEELDEIDDNGVPVRKDEEDEFDNDIKKGERFLISRKAWQQHDGVLGRQDWLPNDDLMTFYSLLTTRSDSVNLFTLTT